MKKTLILKRPKKPFPQWLAEKRAEDLTVHVADLRVRIGARRAIAHSDKEVARIDRMRDRAFARAFRPVEKLQKELSKAAARLILSHPALKAMVFNRRRQYHNTTGGCFWFATRRYGKDLKALNKTIGGGYPTFTACVMANVRISATFNAASVKMELFIAHHRGKKDEGRVARLYQRALKIIGGFDAATRRAEKEAKRKVSNGQS